MSESQSVERQGAQPSRVCPTGRELRGEAEGSNQGRDYLSVKLDDSSFASPIFANLFDDESGEGYSLIWSRRRPSGE